MLELLDNLDIRFSSKIQIRTAVLKFQGIQPRSGVTFPMNSQNLPLNRDLVFRIEDYLMAQAAAGDKSACQLLRELLQVSNRPRSTPFNHLLENCEQLGYRFITSVR